MERHIKSLLLFLLLALVCFSAIDSVDCPNSTDKSLSCHTDFNRTITCVWNSTYVSDHADSKCKVDGKKVGGYDRIHSSCELKSVNVSGPSMKKCSMVFTRRSTFLSSYILTMSVSCDTKQISSTFFKPACNVKLNQPPKPDVNFTTVSWIAQTFESKMRYDIQLQWKQEDQSWSDTMQKNKSNCVWKCETELDPDKLIQGETYEARIRVKAANYQSVWSEWGPSTSWLSLVGKVKPSPPTPQLDIVGGVLAAVILCLVVIVLWTKKTTWIYIVKKIKGPPLPSPAKSFLQNANFQNWMSPHLTSDSFPPFWKSIDIVSVEVTSTVDGVAPSGPQAALFEKMRSESSYDSTNSGFSNPSYSQVSPPPTVTLGGSLQLCGSDTRFGSGGSEGVGIKVKQDRDEILKILSMVSKASVSVLVDSDYEKVEKTQIERCRLQSLDSGMCSGEEVSQESLEADSITVTDSHDGEPEGKERQILHGREIDFKKLFGGSGDIVGRGSIQVCSGYEQVQKVQADSPDFLSVDSGTCVVGERQMSQEESQEDSQEESLEDADRSAESTSLLFPPSPPAVLSALPFALPAFTPLPLTFSAPGLKPLPSHILERIAPMSANRSVEPSGDGYMPVTQEES